jgi:putative membrane protein
MVEYDNKSWLKLFLTLEGSVLPSIMPRILICGVFAAAIQALHLWVTPLNGVVATPWQLVGLALGLLLVFRTNTAYERYWEGRRMWGAVVNSTRNFTVATLSYLDPSHADTPAIQQRLIKLIAAYPALMKQRLRDEKNLEEVAHLITESDKAVLTAASNVPLTLEILIARTLHEAQQKNLFTPPQIRIWDLSLVELINALGACERIKNTPLPIAYVLHLKRFLYIFCLSLPFPLASSFGWWSVLIVMLFGYAFIGIEEIGVEIEDPFGTDPNDLPLDKICQTIQSTLLDTLNKHTV